MQKHPTASDKSPLAFSSDEHTRYSRHFNLPLVGPTGQQQLKAARVLCIGAGGLGCPVLLYLAAAGVGTLGIVDHDIVDLSNLQRQVLYTTQDIGQPKAIAAKTRLHALNPHCTVISHSVALTHDNALALIQDYDIVVDGTDNFAARYLINDACFHLQKPLVYAGIFQFEGQCSVFNVTNNPCYRCLYAAPPPPGLMPNCAEGGVLGVLPGILGTLQANEVLKLILGIGTPLVGRLLTVDALTLQFQEFAVQKNPDCCLCTHHQPFESLPYHAATTCAQQPLEMEQDTISVREFYALQQQQADFVLLDVREPYEHQGSNIGGILIPLAQLPACLDKLDKSKSYIVYCRVGERSHFAMTLMQAAGFNSVKNLAGGLKAWAREIDPKMVVY